MTDRGPGSHERDWADRQRRNDESRNRAEAHREPWSEEEAGLLADWDGTEAELEVIAELLGRTIEACRQRYYVQRRGHAVTHTVTFQVTTGWLVGYCFECGRFTDVYSNGTVSLCEDCR